MSANTEAYFAFFDAGVLKRALYPFVDESALIMKSVINGCVFGSMSDFQQTVYDLFDGYWLSENGITDANFIEYQPFTVLSTSELAERLNPDGMLCNNAVCVYFYVENQP